jgi:heat shock protein HslJ
MPDHFKRSVIAALSVVFALGGCVNNAAGGAPDALMSKTWQLESMLSDGIEQNVLAQTDVTVLFTDDGKVSGSAGCNRYFAAYLIDGLDLKIEQVATTRMHCAEPVGVMTQEYRLVETLALIAAYRIDKNQLLLIDDRGRSLLVFR